jgi:hypothetical protein
MGVIGVSEEHIAIQLVTVTRNSNPHILFKIRFTFSLTPLPSADARTDMFSPLSLSQCIPAHLEHITDIPFHEKLSVFYGKQISITIF